METEKSHFFRYLTIGRSLLALSAASVLLTACASPGTSGVTSGQEREQEQEPVASVHEGEWKLVWSDEFGGTKIDQSKWSHETDCWGGGNEERQCYTDSPKNSFVEDGFLYIKALKESATGYALPEKMRADADDPNATKRQPFTSARLNTKGKADWRYGRVETRAKMPKGQGTWSAIWMLPTEEIYGSWAASGEIDIVEAVNHGTKCKQCTGEKENRIIGTIHYGGEWPKNTHKGKKAALKPSPDGFHTYAVEWKQGEISWFVDGEKYSTLTAKDWKSPNLRVSKNNPAAPFDQPFHLIMNLAIGGHLSESENEGSVDLKGYPKSLIVDWIRVYQRSGSGK